MKLPG